MKPLAVHQSTHIFSLFVFYIKFGPFVAFLHNCKQGKAHKGGGRQHVIQPVGPHPWYLATKSQVLDKKKELQNRSPTPNPWYLATKSFKLLRKQNKYRKREKCLSEILILNWKSNAPLKRNWLHYVPKPVLLVKMSRWHYEPSGLPWTLVLTLSIIITTWKTRRKTRETELKPRTWKVPQTISLTGNDISTNSSWESCWSQKKRICFRDLVS